MSDALAGLLSAAGSAAASTSTVACTWVFIDEPTMPKSLIK